MSVWRGVLLLSIASLLAKVLSATYRVPFQNMAGDVGYYVYQQVYPLYGMIATITMYGIPVVLSKEFVTLSKRKSRLILSNVFYGLLLLTFISWFVLFYYAPLVAHLMGDEQLIEPLRAMSFILLIIPFLSVERGFDQSQGNFTRTAVAHVIDQFIRVALILSFTYVLVKNHADAYTIGSGAAYGTVIGSVVGTIILLILTKAQLFKQLLSPRHLSIKTFLSINKRFFIQSGLICLSSLVLVIFQMVDSFTMIHLLQFHHVSLFESIVAKGIYDRGQPLIQVGTIMTTTFSLAVVPLISKAINKKEYSLAEKYEEIAIRLTFLISGAATVGLIIIMPPTNVMLFTNSSGSMTLRILALVVIFYATFVILAAILQGYKKEHLPARAVFYGVCIKLCTNMMFIPFLGINGAAIATVLSLIVMVGYLYRHLYRKKNRSCSEKRVYLSISALLFIMGGMTSLWKWIVEQRVDELSRLHAAVVSLSSVAIGALIFLIGFFMLPIFKENEWEHIPLIGRIKTKFAKKKRSNTLQ